MRELISFAIMYTSFSWGVDLKEGGLFSSFMFVVGLGALIFFSVSIVEKFFARDIRQWYRITPGEQTVIDEEEWAKLGKVDHTDSHATSPVATQAATQAIAPNITPSDHFASQDSIDFFNQTQPTTETKNSASPPETFDSEINNEFDDIFSGDKDK